MCASVRDRADLAAHRVAWPNDPISRILPAASDALWPPLSVERTRLLHQRDANGVGGSHTRQNQPAPARMEFWRTTAAHLSMGSEKRPIEQLDEHASRELRDSFVGIDQ
jgi:hypothetical protein